MTCLGDAALSTPSRPAQPRVGLRWATAVIVETHDEKIMPRFRVLYEVRNGEAITVHGLEWSGKNRGAEEALRNRSNSVTFCTPLPLTSHKQAAGRHRGCRNYATQREFVDVIHQSLGLHSEAVDFSWLFWQSGWGAGNLSPHSSEYQRSSALYCCTFEQEVPLLRSQANFSNRCSSVRGDSKQPSRCQTPLATGGS